MLSKEEFVHWAQSLNLSDLAKAELERIRSSPPSRRVESKAGNVSGRYPSRKMGMTIQFESHKGELALIYEYEHDPDVFEYYDQPPSIKLCYLTKKEKPQSVNHTPDFFVLRQSSAGWEECKIEKDLHRLADQMPHRYVQEEGQWRCPPGESYAQQFGLYYRFRSSGQIDWTYHRNIQFLEDYFRADGALISDRCREIVRSYTQEKSVIVLSDLLGDVLAYGISADDIYALIATEELQVNLSAAPLAEPQRVKVFHDQETAEIYRKMTNIPTQRPTHSLRLIDLTVGARLLWDGSERTILNIGASIISLQGENGAFSDISIEMLEDLVKQGKVTGRPLQFGLEHNAEAGRLMTGASPDALKEANRRFEVIWPQLHGEIGSASSVPGRTARRWRAMYRKAEQLYGCGFIGLIPRIGKRGNRIGKLPEETRELMRSVIEHDYETVKQQAMAPVYNSLIKKCELKDLQEPSYRTFTLAVHRRPCHEQTKKRQGKRAAYKFEEFYWMLEMTTPRHGDRPFEIGHIDHTELDIEVIDSGTGRNLGRPWATFLTDAFSRRLLAFVLLFDPPSNRSCMMVLRECVRRHNRLPQILVVDGGPEFSSTYFETLLGRYEVTKKQRPGGKPRFGSVCERLFGTTNTRFIHNLAGNTQIMKQVRQVTKSVNPKRHAIWTLERLFEWMSVWAYEIYDTIEHQALGQSPREAYNQGILQSGSRLHRLIPYDDNFVIWTMPAPRKEDPKVVPGRGVKINHVYYWSSAFRNPEVEKRRVDVRYDPYDAGHAYAWVGEQWVECISDHRSDFRGRSEKEVKIATLELRQRLGVHSKRSNITARKLGDFLTSVESEECLAMQRKRDAEARAVFRLMEGGERASVNMDNLAEEGGKRSVETENNLADVEDGREEFEFEDYGEF
jgi:putative transposase